MVENVPDISPLSETRERTAETVESQVAFVYGACREEALAVTLTPQEKRDGYFCARHHAQIEAGEVCPMCYEAFVLAVADARQRWIEGVASAPEVTGTDDR